MICRTEVDWLFSPKARSARSTRRKAKMSARTERVADIGRKNLESFRVSLVLDCMAWIAVFGHLLLIPLFAVLGVQRLALSCAMSSLIWVAVLVLNRKGHHDAAFLVGFLQVLGQAFHGVEALGWGSGFQYYLLPTVLFVLIHPTWRDISRLITPILLCALYLALNLYSRVVAPGVILDPAPLHLVNCLNIVVIFLVLSVFAHKYRVAVRSAERSLQEANRRLDLLAATDPLTGLLNRRDMRRRINDEMGRLRIGGEPFVLVMSDIDNFKSFNDRHGHDCGDFALVSVANLLRKCLRKRDHVARWGGEEFLLLLPGTDLDEGAAVAERVRATIEAASLLYEGSGLSITMTFGVAVCDRPQSVEDCVRAADRALYVAKREARNCVILAGHEAAPEQPSVLHARLDAHPVGSPAQPVGAPRPH